MNSIRSSAILARADHLDREGIRENRSVEKATETDKVAAKENAIEQRKIAAEKESDAASQKSLFSFVGGLIALAAAVLVIPGIAVIGAAVAVAAGAGGALLGVIGGLLANGKESDAKDAEINASRQDLVATKLESEQSAAAAQRSELQQAKRQRMAQVLEMTKDGERALAEARR